MKFHKEFRFEAPLADVYAMLGDAAFREKVAAQAGADSYDVTLTPDGADGFASVVETQQSSRDLPGIARKFLGDEIRILQEERWTSATHGDVTVSIPGKPGQIAGSVDVAPAGDGVTETVSLEITVSIPFVGGKIESLIGDKLKRSLETENHVGRTWLEGQA